jgi:hypothetical protein
MRRVKDITIWGETLQGWKEIAIELSGGLALRLFELALILGGIYALVRFVKWAWER